MRRILAFLLLLPLGLAFAPAQSIHILAGGGFSSQFGKNPAGDHARYGGAYLLGVGYEWEFSQQWTFLPSIRYAAKGWNEPSRQMSITDASTGLPAVDPDTGAPLYSTLRRKSVAHFLEIPLLFHFYHRLAPSRYLTFAAGPYVGVGLAGKRTTEGDASFDDARRLHYEDHLYDIHGTQRFESGIMVKGGVQLPSALTVALEASCALTPQESHGRRNCVLSLTLSYALRPGQKAAR